STSAPSFSFEEGLFHQPRKAGAMSDPQEIPIEIVETHSAAPGETAGGAEVFEAFLDTPHGGGAEVIEIVETHADGTQDIAFLVVGEGSGDEAFAAEAAPGEALADHHDPASGHD